ncbi:MAG: prepilin-type N-terminal cleavage/methylation domain-containing protein [Tepidisphaeraceae bacterium]|jgi:prepilin-type N-terminal cleavage/methylation domain-containing protein
MQRKLETRNPKLESNSKLEIRTNPRFVIRASDFIRHSDFGFRISRAAGFTLTELLIVIGIITILIGILLPVVNRVRRIAYVADTQNEISQLANACNQYYTTFHAYPGPFSNDDTAGNLNSTIGNPSGAATLTQLYFNGSYVTSLPTNATYGPVNATWTVTGAENLVLGLMGGLRLNTTSGTPPYPLAFAPTEVGLGPMSLNPSNPSRTPSFFPAGSNYLMWCQTVGSNGPNVQTTGLYQSQTNPPTFTGTAFTDPAGTPAGEVVGSPPAGDCPIPVFVDRFPSPGPLPILYLRARTGAKGVVWDNGKNGDKDPNGNVAYYQYDLRDITPYTYSHVGLPATNQWGTNVTHNLIGITTFNGSVTSVSAMTPPAPGYPLPNAGQYFINPSIPPTDQSSNASINYTGRPRAVDQFILISAGPDGIYGTADDITSFGDVSQ